MHLLAVDGGQSTIRIGHSGLRAPIEVEGVSRLEGDIISSVSAAVVDGWTASGAPLVDRAMLGLTTAPTDRSSQAALCERVAAGIAANEIWLADDAVTAHAGALSLGWGVSITVGTGVACLAMPRTGSPRIIGGHGYLLGDDGGAYWLGRAGIRAVLRAADGRTAATALSERAEQHFDGLEDLGERLHGLPRPVDAIARFAPVVLETADGGDAVADGIVDVAVEELVMLARAAAASVADPGAPVPLALGGRLLQPGPLRRRLDRALAADASLTAVRTADGTPFEGALLLGEGSDPGRYAELVYTWGASG